MPLAVGVALVTAQDPDGSEAEPRVRPDRPLVGGGGIDREAMVPALLDQVPDGEPQRLGAEALALVRSGDRDVERRVAGHPERLLAEQQQPGELPADLDRERRLFAI